MSARLNLGVAAAVLVLAASAGSAQAFCPNEQIIVSPITISGPIQCGRITGAIIAGDVVNDTTIGDSSPDNTFVIEYSTVTGRFINNGTMLQLNPALVSNIAFATWGTDIQGGIVNNGSILSGPNGIAMSIGAILSGLPVASNQTGAIDNFGTMSGGIAGFDGVAGSFANRLWNHQGATISGGVLGVMTESTFSLWTGGILNDGTISGGGNGINLGQNNTVPLTFSGGITNSATGTITGTNFSAIVIFNTEFSGGIANAGLISGNTGGIAIVGAANNFSGGIVNSATGVITGNTASGVFIQALSFTGDIDNAGRIASTLAQGIVALPVSTFNGDIVNRAGGLIEGATGGIVIGSPNWLGDLSNAGTIRANATGNGVLISNPTGQWDGSVTNSGLMQGAAGPVLQTAGLLVDVGEWNGGIVNNGTMTSLRVGVLVNADIWNGSVDNRGTMGAGGAFSGLLIASNTLTGAISNGATGVMEGQTVGFSICDALCSTASIQTGVDFIGTFTNAGRIANAGVVFGPAPLGALNIFANSWTGDILNETGGVISSPTLAVAMRKQDAFFGINVGLLPVALFDGDFINRGTIAGAVELRIAQWTGNFNNTGTVNAATTDAVLIDNELGIWDGGIVNDGTIQGGVGPDVLGQAALHVELAEWNGGILNRGNILSGATGVLAGVDIWNGNFDNRGLILGSAGVAIGSDTFTGNILNAAGATMRGNIFGLGICHSGCQEDIAQTGVNFVGSLINAGDISKQDTTLDGGQPLGALTIFANTWTGDIVNQATGTIRAPTLAVPTFAVTMTKQNAFLGEGVDPLPVVTFNGNFINRGAITGTVDLRIANWTGNFDNSGSVSAFFPGAAAFKFTGGLNGLLLNSGTIAGPVALDLSGTTSAATYRQTGATARTEGNILLSTTAATTVDFRGGQLTGNVIGAGGDDLFQVNAGTGSFAYLQGALSNLASLSVNSGTAIFGSSAIGTNGAGVTMTNVGTLSVGAGAVLYLDDNTSISATSLNLTPTSTLAAFLTTNTAQHGSITVSSGATLGGAFVAHLDPMSFAGTSQSSFQYNNLIAGPTTGSFSSVTIAGGPSIFNITPIYGSFSVLVSRTPFDELADEGSPNQENVGSAIEEIYQDGTSDPDLLNLINTIASDPDAAGDIYDAIAGATQAETDFATAKAGDPWKQSVAQRVDAARSTGCTVTGDSWCRTRYAQVTAAPVQTDAGEDPDAFAWLDEGLRDVGATSVWGRVVGILGESDGGVSSPASTHRTYGLIAGADHVVDGTLLVGLAGQYIRTKADFDGSENESSVESIQAGAYFSYGAETYLNGNASVIVSHASTKRIFSVGAIDYLAEVRYPSTSFTGSLDLGRIFEIGDGYRLEPHAGLNVVAQFTDAYAEHGAGGLGLIVDPEDVHSLRSMIGARASRVFDLGDRKMVPELRLEWRHEYLDRNTTFLAAFQGAPDATFLVHCEPVARDVVVVGGALTLPLAGRITGYLDAEGAFSEDTRAGLLSLGARATW